MQEDSTPTTQLGRPNQNRELTPKLPLAVSVKRRIKAVLPHLRISTVYVNISCLATDTCNVVRYRNSVSLGTRLDVTRLNSNKRALVKTSALHVGSWRYAKMTEGTPKKRRKTLSSEVKLLEGAERSLLTEEDVEWSCEEMRSKELWLLQVPRDVSE